MFYVKNISSGERILRVAVGLCGLGFAWVMLGSSVIGVAAGIMGAMLSVTGLAGFCPMCAMAGRKTAGTHNMDKKA